MNIVAIVVTYNGAKFIDHCFGSLRDSKIPVHIIAIDNASTDGTVEKLRSDYPEVELIVNKKNIGFGRANNIGLKKALDDNADYIFLLNQDAWVEPDTIKELIKIQAANQHYGILSPMHYDIINKSQIDKHCSIAFSNELLSDLIHKSVLKKVYTIDSIHAAIWLISKECLQSVGGFDPIFYYREEDIDYIYRVKKKGFSFGLAPSIKSYHRGSMNRNDQITLKKQYIYLKGEKLIFFKKYLSENIIKLFFLVQIDNFFDGTKYLLKLKLKKAFIYFRIFNDIVWLFPKINDSRKKTIKNNCPFI